VEHQLGELEPGLGVEFPFASDEAFALLQAFEALLEGTDFSQQAGQFHGVVGAGGLETHRLPQGREAFPRFAQLPQQQAANLQAMGPQVLVVAGGERIEAGQGFVGTLELAQQLRVPQPVPGRSRIECQKTAGGIQGLGQVSAAAAEIDSLMARNDSCE
jgi:hypothetical protein